MSAPSVLLVYANPAITASPVPPHGMERVGQAFRLAGCRVHLLAPFIEEDPLRCLREALAAGPWALCGFSLRNLDDALVVRGAEEPADGRPIDTEGYLDRVAPLVRSAVQALGPRAVLLGGTGFSCAPEAILRALGASWGIVGPAEDLAWRLGRALVRGEGPSLPPDPRLAVVDEHGPAPPPPLPGPPHAPLSRPRAFAREARPAPGPVPRMGPYLGLALARGARVPVLFSSGCDRRCAFCVEARFTGGVVQPRPTEQILAEIEDLVALGVRRFWLAGSELNVPDDRAAIRLLRALEGRGLDLQGFIQVAPVREELLDAMEGAGLDPTGLSFELGHLDDRLLRAGAGPANLPAIERLVDLWLRRGYRSLGGSILLGAHPEEDERSLESALARARQIDAALPDGLGLAYATGGRVYPNSPLGDWVAAHPEEARPHLYGADDPRFLEPVVFCRPGPPRLLLRRVQAALAGCRGRMGPMNTEAPSGDALRVEALVNRALWRVQEDRQPEAEALLRAALELDPRHLEALASLARLLANHAAQPVAAREVLIRLRAALGEGDPRRAEVEEAILRLGPAGPRP